MIDFHLHTLISDGDLEPRALAALVMGAGVTRWAVTDHDAIDAWRALAGAPGLVPGVELSAALAGREVHIVGLAFAPDDAAFNALLADQQRLRRERIHRLAELIPAPWRRGLDVGALAAPPCVSPGRSHLARALARRVPGGMGSVSPWLDDRQLAAAGVNPFPSPAAACAAIAAAGGLAILAHPACYGGLAEIIPVVDACGAHLAGIEDRKSVV